MRLRWLAAAAALALMIDPVAAQSESRSRARTATTEAAAPAAGQSTPRARRPRSAAQLRNDQIMRECGAEWRANKTALQAAGKTWRSFLPECRTRRRG